jgi:hypothetical protein
MTENSDFEQVYLDVLSCTKEMLEEYDALAVAAAMLSQALSIYKTTLSEEEFNAILDAVLSKKDMIKTFAPRNVH